MADTSKSTLQNQSISGNRIGLMQYNAVAKRLCDIVLSLFLLPIIFPLVALLYLLVRLDGGPGFFGHARVGRNGEIFKCWKIRTMVPDAQSRLETFLATSAEARDEWERDRKLRNDPRITRIGDFLRKSSMDELPQIWNVLKGEMSLIGPRPVTEPELERYGGHKWVYLSLRPGITGLWQVSGRNDITYAERVTLDADYYNTLSFMGDTRILIRTAGVVINRTGC